MGSYSQKVKARDKREYPPVQVQHRVEGLWVPGIRFDLHTKPLISTDAF